MLFKVKGITVSVTFPFAAIVTLMLILCDRDIVLISLLSSFLHELGHLLFMLLFAEKAEKIVLGAFGMRIERASVRCLSYNKEAVIAFGGIFLNIIIASTGLLFYLFTGSVFGKYLFAVNVFIALFNLMPVRQLDCGRGIEYLLLSRYGAAKTEKIISVISFSFLGVLAVGCFTYNAIVKINVSLIAVTIYLIIISTLKEFKNDK